MRVDYREEPLKEQSTSYLLSGQASELPRLQVQSRVWEPAARELLAEFPSGNGKRALDVGCGVMGWLGALSAWVGTTGGVVGTDVDEKMLAGAKQYLEDSELTNVELKQDDLFNSALPERSFDLVHARFQIAPLGRGSEQVAIYLKWVRPGGLLVLEDPDMSSWRINPAAPSAQRLIELIAVGFQQNGGDFNAGRSLVSLLCDAGLKPGIRARIVALESGHPYLRLPIQFATSLRSRLLELVNAGELDGLISDTEAELARPGTWGTTFTLIQAFATTRPE